MYKIPNWSPVMHYGCLVCSELSINISSKLFLEYVVYINLTLSWV